MQGDSAVSICNQVLMPLGLKPLLNLADTNERARACNQLFWPSVREVLAARTWSFAQARAQPVRFPDVGMRVSGGFQFVSHVLLAQHDV